MTRVESPIVIEVKTARPYVGTEYIVVEPEVPALESVRLPHALRTLTHLDRYIKREKDRVRISGQTVDLTRITGRSKINPWKRK